MGKKKLKNDRWRQKLRERLLLLEQFTKYECHNLEITSEQFFSLHFGFTSVAAPVDIKIAKKKRGKKNVNSVTVSLRRFKVTIEWHLAQRSPCRALTLSRRAENHLIKSA